MQITSRSMPARSYNGLSATTICIVEQFGLAMIPWWCSSASGLTSLTTSGIVVVHAPARGVVDDDGARAREARCPLPGGGAAGGEERDVESCDRVLVEPLHDEPAVELAPDRALGCERHDLACREVPLAQQLEHQRAHLSGGAYDRDAIAPAAHRPRVARGLRLRA